MINGKSVIAIIPARGGSKGLPGKNIKSLCGKPLIAWSIEAGLGCQYIDEVMVTTDNEEIANISKRFGASVPFIRPFELASDTATSFDVVKHTLDFYNREFNRCFEYVILLEPTSPLRQQNDLQKMLEKICFMSNEYDAIISLGEVHEHPSIMKKIEGSEVESYDKEMCMVARRQDNEAVYFPYGVAYILKIETLLSEKSFYPCRTTYYLIERYQCYEIDDMYDFLAVENIMKYQLELK